MVNLHTLHPLGYDFQNLPDVPCIAECGSFCWCSSTLSDGSSSFTIIWFRAQWFEIYRFSIVFLQRVLFCFHLFPSIHIHIRRPRGVWGLPPANSRNFQPFPGAWMRDSVQHSAWAFQNGIPTSKQMGSHSLGTYLCYIGIILGTMNMENDGLKWSDQESGRVVSWSERFHAHVGPALASQGRDSKTGQSQATRTTCQEKNTTLGDSNI